MSNNIIANDKKRKKVIMLIVITLVVINLLVFSVLFLDLSKYIWPEKNTGNETDGIYRLSEDGTVTIDGITYKQKEDNNLIVIFADKSIINANIRNKINETDEYVVDEIGEKAFENCENITSIMIPDTIVKIGNYVFSGCKQLSTVTIPTGVKEIGESCFYDCYELASIKVAVENETYKDYNGVLYNKDGKKLYVYPYSKSDEEYKLSDNLESIENNVFRGFKKLKSVSLPESVTYIGDTVFENCENLDNVLIPKNVTSIGKNAFSNCSKNLVIYGEKDSYAEKYSKENNITFKLSSERPTITTNETTSNNNKPTNTMSNTTMENTTTNKTVTNNTTNTLSNTTTNNRLNSANNNTVTNSVNTVKSIIEIQ